MGGVVTLVGADIGAEGLVLLVLLGDTSVEGVFVLVGFIVFLVVQV